MQFLGARGYFATYDARPEAPLDAATAADWTRRSGVPLRVGEPRGAACLRISEAGAAG